ncbi:hypothetical protein GWI33_010571 [Rhynchophorus ferrugineus]|uniref:Uncharacterized protein n=1 Tax=Rhynchophorus ferrugineus TaxID=354439 RepID=A0A834IX38_RHYFE|nr:hypothetical protein GWI33_010571 [Rhynchophorus ferrugineus]
MLLRGIHFLANNQLKFINSSEQCSKNTDRHCSDTACLRRRSLDDFSAFLTTTDTIFPSNLVERVLLRDMDAGFQGRSGSCRLERSDQDDDMD